MRDKFHTVLLIALAFSLGYVVAVKPAFGYGSGPYDSLYRMANVLERIEQNLSRCPR